MRSLGYMPNEVELEVIIQRLDMDGEHCPLSVSSPLTWGLCPHYQPPQAWQITATSGPISQPGESELRGQSVIIPATP